MDTKEETSKSLGPSLNEKRHHDVGKGKAEEWRAKNLSFGVQVSR